MHFPLRSTRLSLSNFTRNLTHTLWDRQKVKPTASMLIFVQSAYFCFHSAAGDRFRCVVSIPFGHSPTCLGIRSHNTNHVYIREKSVFWIEHEKYFIVIAVHSVVDKISSCVHYRAVEVSSPRLSHINDLVSIYLFIFLGVCVGERGVM